MKKILSIIVTVLVLSSLLVACGQKRVQAMLYKM